MTIYRIAYHSWSTIQDVGRETGPEIDHILRTARSRNEAASVSGVLMHSEGRFVGVLEGRKAAVKAIYARIQTDWRHGDVAILGEGPGPRRWFKPWPLIFAGYSLKAQAYFWHHSAQKDYDFSLDGLCQVLRDMIDIDEMSPAGE